MDPTLRKIDNLKEPGDKFSNMTPSLCFPLEFYSMHPYFRSLIHFELIVVSGIRSDLISFFYT